MSKPATEDLDAFYAGFTPAVIRRPELMVGDRVIVCDRSHPHYGETAEVTTEPRMVSILGMAPRMWLEARGDWTEFGVEPRQVRRIADLDDRPRQRRRAR
jgi:hypothetical protein